MFRLYYFFNPNSPSLIYSSDDLGPCLNFIEHNNYVHSKCTIVSPNNRKITFNSNNELVFGTINNY